MVVIWFPSCMRARLRQESTRLPLTWTVHAPHCPWSQPFFVPVSATVSRMQSSSVVRGSIFSLWSLPLIRSVIGTAPSTVERLTSLAFVGSTAPVACAGKYAEIMLAAAAVPLVFRKFRRHRSMGFESPAILAPTSGESAFELSFSLNDHL